MIFSSSNLFVVIPAEGYVFGLAGDIFTDRSEAEHFAGVLEGIEGIKHTAVTLEQGIIKLTQDVHHDA